MLSLLLGTCAACGMPVDPAPAVSELQADEQTAPPEPSPPEEEPVEIKPEMRFASNCPCVNTACSRHGFCDVCKEFHTHMDHLSTCMRREAPKPL